MDEEKDYEVGYGKPPRGGRFMKGASGNPSGRPRGRKNIATTLHAVMYEVINVRENGKDKAMPKLEAMMRQLVSKALSGDLKAMKEIMQWDRIFQEAAERAVVDGPDTAKDEEVVRSFFNRMKTALDQPIEETPVTEHEPTKKDEGSPDD